VVVLAAGLDSLDHLFHRFCCGFGSMFEYCWSLGVGRVLLGLVWSVGWWISIVCRLDCSLGGVVVRLRCCIRVRYVGLLDSLVVRVLLEGRGVLALVVRVVRRHARQKAPL
jgi:hypothetical protein